MSKINLKTDYEDGQILHGDELNVNNEVTQLGVNDNFDRITALDTNKANKSYVDTIVAEKADATATNNAISTLNLTKADKSELATKADQSALDEKASITYVDSAVSPKADKSYVDTALSTKANSSDVSSALDLKANKSYVDAQLATKADTSDVESALATKTSKTYVDTALNAKADIDDVDAALALKENKTTIGNLSDLTTDVKTSIVAAINSIDVEASPIATTSTPGLVKPDGTTITVDQDGTIHSAGGGGGGGTSDYSQLSNKPQINSVELSGNKSLSDLGLMSATDINTSLGLKADKSTTYTKTQIDTTVSGINDAIDAKADKSTTYTKSQIDSTVSSLNDDIAAKANQSTTYTKTETDSAISTAISGKADTSTVNTALEGKADKSTTYTKTAVDQLITSSEAGTDAKLLLKADAATTYTKTEVDSAVSAKADGLSFSNNELQLKSGNTLIGNSVEIEVTKNEIAIQSTQPSDTDTKLWINQQEMDSIASEVVNSYNTRNDKAYSADYTNRLHTYSTTEQRIGTWIDNKPVYRKVISIDSLPNATTQDYAHGILNIKNIVSCYGFYYNNAGQSNFEACPISGAFPTSSLVQYGVIVSGVTSTNVSIFAGTDRISYSAYVILEYTKTTD